MRKKENLPGKTMIPDETKKLAAILHDVINEIIAGDDKTNENLRRLQEVCRRIMGGE